MRPLRIADTTIPLCLQAAIERSFIQGAITLKSGEGIDQVIAESRAFAALTAIHIHLDDRVKAHRLLNVDQSYCRLNSKLTPSSSPQNAVSDVQLSTV